MSNSNRSGSFSRRSGTVTVIEEPVRRSAARNSQIVFWVAWIATGLLAATVTASMWRPVLALFAGALIGLVIATIAAALVVAWPVLRVIWWWAIEITALTGLIGGWIELASHTALIVRLPIVAAIAGIPVAIRPVRRCIAAVAWCLITRHRIRSCFSEFIITNRYGSLPLMLWAQPTPVGERVWVWLRPGLALDDIQERLDLIAVACWGSAATAEAASRTNSALLRLDIKRRDALTGTVQFPLTGLLPIGSSHRPAPVSPAIVPTALDLADITASDITPVRSARDHKPSWPTAPATATAPTVTARDDVSDWI
jgi:hypothetical protein